MAVLIVVFDALALALALDGTRTVAAYSLSEEMTSLISISYLAAGLGQAEMSLDTQSPVPAMTIIK